MKKIIILLINAILFTACSAPLPTGYSEEMYEQTQKAKEIAQAYIDDKIEATDAASRIKAIATKAQEIAAEHEGIPKYSVDPIAASNIDSLALYISMNKSKYDIEQFINSMP